MNEDTRKALGRRGEELAVRHLRELGLTVLDRNVRTRHGEIDVIAFGASTLIFAEVKTRRMGSGQSAPRPDQLPLAGLGARQRARLRALAAAWLADRGNSRPSAEKIRFDAVGVVIDGLGRLRAIEHVEDAW